ncbi:MAG: CBS domain-containing protein [Marinobacter sp.]
MNVKNVMNPKNVLVNPSTSIKDAASRMAEDKVGFLPVGENDRLQGTVTDRDIVVRAICFGKDPQNTAIRDVLTDELVCCSEDDDVEQAAQKMDQHQVRRLPVVDNDKRFVGVVSIGDLAQHVDASTAGKVLSGVTGWG